MKIIPLPSQSGSRIIKAILTWKDLTAAATTQVINLFPDPTGQASQTLMPVGTSVIFTSMRMKTPFTGGSISAMVLDAGDLASAGRYIANANTDLFTAEASNTKSQVVSVTSFGYTGSVVAANNSVLTAKFTATGGNVNTATAGRVELLFELMELFRFDDPIEPGIIG
jgi:hypothetical protein